MSRVSVIVPIYNAEKYIFSSLSNYFEQDYDDIEYILVDDGSTDHSLEICRSLSKSRDNVKIISQNNSGVSKARNVGIENSTGKYLIFLDADDYVDSNMISTMVKEAVKTDADMVSCGISMELERKDGSHSVQSNLYYSKSKAVLSSKEDINNKMLDLWEKAVPYNSVNKLYKSNLIKENGILFADLTMGEDLEFNTQVLLKCNKIALLPDCFYHYIREREGAATTKYVKNWFRIRKEENKRILQFFNELRSPENISSLDSEYIARRFINRVIGCMENEFRSGNPNNKYYAIKQMIEDDEVQQSARITKKNSTAIRVLVILIKNRLVILCYAAIATISFVKKYSPRLFEYLKYRR